MAADDTAARDVARLDEVEAKLTLAEDLLDTLNALVYRQQQHIDRLQRELGALREQVEGLSVSLEAKAPRDELPPHY